MEDYISDWAHRIAVAIEGSDKVAMCAQPSRNRFEDSSLCIPTRPVCITTRCLFMLEFTKKSLAHMQ